MRFFKASVFCGIASLLLLVAVPGPDNVFAADTAVRTLAISGVSLTGITMLLSLFSLTTGAVAWRKGTRHCGWIFVAAVIFVVPFVLLLSIVLTV